MGKLNRSHIPRFHLLGVSVIVLALNFVNLASCEHVAPPKVARLLLSHSGPKDPPTDWQGAPWQPSGSSMEESMLPDLPATVFSPTGRLHAVEQYVGASNSDNPQWNLAIALRCKSGVVVVTTIPRSPHLRDINTTDALGAVRFSPNESLSAPLFQVYSSVAAVTAGNPIDGHVLRTKISSLVKGAPEKVSRLARRLADRLQTPTQSLGGNVGRMLASSALLSGDNEIWKIEPSGQLWRCHAAAIGFKGDDVEEEVYRLLSLDNFSEESVDVFSRLKSLSPAEALELICQTITNVLWPKTSSNIPQRSVYWLGIVLDNDHGRTEWRPTVHRGELAAPNRTEGK